jgi:glucuronate isomerase
VNSRAFAALGPDTGYDCVGNNIDAEKFARLLDFMAQNAGGLPKTVVYSLNPADYYPLSTIIGGFQGGARGKMQLGAAWWFLDNRDGMEQQLKILANSGVLPLFVGMLTDSRSFLSYPRHEYFRRILCNLVGGWVDNGEYPADMDTLKRMVKDIAFGNAKEYFT